MIVSPESKTCPPGWVGIVRITDKAVVTCPDRLSADYMRKACRRVDLVALTDERLLSELLSITEFLGPAWLSYVDAKEFQERPSADVETGTASEPPSFPAIEVRIALRRISTAR